MYSVLKDIRTGTYYMEGRKSSFYAFSNEDNFDLKKIPVRDRGYVRLVGTEIEDKKELETEFYNAGFYEGYIDGELFRIKRNVYYFNRNPNELCYAQYLLTKNDEYLTNIKKDKLFTLARIDNSTFPAQAYFPVGKLDSGEYAILTYTNEGRMPNELINKYIGWKIVKMTWDTKCIVNDNFVIV